MKYKRIILAVTLVSLFICPSAAISKNSGGNYLEDLNVERQKLSNYIEWFRKTFSQNGDVALESLIQQIPFQVSDKPFPNAWVAYDQNSKKKTIYMTAEYRLLITYIADANQVSVHSPEFFPCKNMYINALFDALAGNRQRIANDLPPRRLPAPEIFLETTPAYCNQYKSSFPIDPKFRPARDYSVNVVIGLGYLHELGHIASGHSYVDLSTLDKLTTITQRLNEFLKLMGRSRSQEVEADDWAIDRFVELSNNPIEALSNVLADFYLAFGGFDCSIESADSHPNGYQRFSRQMGRMKDRAIAAGKFPDSQELTLLINDTTELAAKIQYQLKCP
ncbi:hypothetical protein [Desulfuromonas sp. TF]|uniref:hypothetical protein n=1 Tax=Desulfuromonas sp. TF TaxID=1232410 RepID=UPI000423C386|nr:hypothetical protein [Desulfuromonas sp. TF]